MAADFSFGDRSAQVPEGFLEVATRKRPEGDALEQIDDVDEGAMKRDVGEDGVPDADGSLGASEMGHLLPLGWIRPATDRVNETNRHRLAVRKRRAKIARPFAITRRPWPVQAEQQVADEATEHGRRSSAVIQLGEAKQGHERTYGRPAK